MQANYDDPGKKKINKRRDIGGEEPPDPLLTTTDLQAETSDPPPSRAGTITSRCEEAASGGGPERREWWDDIPPLLPLPCREVARAHHQREEGDNESGPGRRKETCGWCPVNDTPQIIIVLSLEKQATAMLTNPNNEGSLD